MSYCRWSSDNWRSDVYVYPSSQGWETHVATNRVVGEIPREPDWGLITTAEAEGTKQFVREHNAVLEYLRTAERTPIGLAHDGESFNDSTPLGCLETLLMLRKEGYHIPEAALEELREESTTQPTEEKE